MVERELVASSGAPGSAGNTASGAPALRLSGGAGGGAARVGGRPALGLVQGLLPAARFPARPELDPDRRPGFNMANLSGNCLIVSLDFWATPEVGALGPVRVRHLGCVECGRCQGGRWTRPVVLGAYLGVIWATGVLHAGAGRFGGFGGAPGRTRAHPGAPGRTRTYPGAPGVS